MRAHGQHLRWLPLAPPAAVDGKSTVNGNGSSFAPDVKRSVRLLRVSTRAQTDTDADLGSNGNSIDTQRRATTDKERDLGTVNVGEYVEPGYSAQSIDKRPFFKVMMQRITQQNDVDFVVIYMRSRVFRNYIEAAIVKQRLEALGVRIVSAGEDFGDGFMAEAMEAVTDVFNWLQVKISGQDIKTKMGNKAKNGGTIGRAKIGYLNVRLRIDGHNVNTIIVDEHRAPFVRMAFEMFAAGGDTLGSLQGKLTSIGFRLPPRPRWPEERPISLEQLRRLLRDPYYTGVVVYDGAEYPGRHQPLIDRDLFDTVQRILDGHSGSGTRHRVHNHYLKGLLWCDRCQHRLIVMAVTGRGGDRYFYYLCRGRQDGVCDLPFLPVEVLEDAVARFYQQFMTPSPSWEQLLKDAVCQSQCTESATPGVVRALYAKRLQTIDRKESYLLDLASEEEWPKAKLRDRIQALHEEADAITDAIWVADNHIDISTQAIAQAGVLLANPGAAYARGNEHLRAAMNRVLLTRLYVDGEKITSAVGPAALGRYEPTAGQYVILREEARHTLHEHSTETG